MGRASIPILLPLDQYAQMMGINPAHFSGGASVNLFPAAGECTDVWLQWGWQGSPMVGREDIAEAIAGVEKDLANYLGFWPAPQYMAREVHPFPRHYRRELFDAGFNKRYDRKSIITKYGKVISAGRRNLQVVGEAVKAGTLVYDLGAQTATITLPTPAGITSASDHQIKVYHDGYQTPEWEIRPPVSVTVGVVSIVIVFHAWQLIKPTLQNAYPTNVAPTPIDITDADSFADAVDVYRVYPDYTQHSVEFFWEPRYIPPWSCPSCTGSGCITCQHTVQCGCLYVRDVHQGIVVPTPADWDDDDEVWVHGTYMLGYAPDQLRMWYYAGDVSDEFLNGYTVNPMSNYWAEIISWMATARLGRPFCSCVNLNARVRDLQMDMTATYPEGPTFFIGERDMSNPFGNRKGEILAWRRVRDLAEKRAKVAVI